MLDILSFIQDRTKLPGGEQLPLLAQKCDLSYELVFLPAVNTDKHTMSRTMKTFLHYILAGLLGLTVLPVLATDSLHDSFDQVLKAHVQDGVVNYAGIKNDANFTKYVELIAETNPDSFKTEQEKLAFWINAYNALAIKGILDGLSPSSFFGRVTFFKTTDYRVGGRDINLYDLERDIIIPFGEPRIHFAIICASMSCPKLRSEVWLASKLEQQFEDNAIDFLNDTSKNNFDRKKKRANLSKIFDWFDKDFKDHSGTVQKYVAQYLNDKELAKEVVEKKYKIKYLKYDWNLNGIPAE